MAEPTEALPRFLTDLLGWQSTTMLALGARTGLLDALQAGGTVDEISARAGVDARNALEWLRAVTAAGHAVCTDGRFALSDETTMVLGPGFPVDARAIIDFAAAAPTVLDAVADAIKAGTGVESAVYREAFGDAVGRINTPTYAAALVGEWVAGVPGMSETLAGGGSVADLACGNGDAAALLARAFPEARVVGYDLDPSLLDRTGLPDNVELRVADAQRLPADEGYDLVTCLDSLHHFGDPQPVADQVHGMLRPGGVFLVAESGLTGDLSVDVADPFALIVYASSVLYCLQENLAAGGAGRAAADGPDWVVGALSGAGFSEVAVRPSPTGYNIITGVA